MNDVIIIICLALSGEMKATVTGIAARKIRRLFRAMLGREGAG